MKRTIAVAVGLLVGAMWLATPAHATPVPAPSPDTSPTAGTPADPCVLPSPTATLEGAPQTSGPAVLDLRKQPKLPLPKECFVEFTDTCKGTLVTLKNPIPRIAIKYRVDGEEGTHTVGSGETEQVNVPKSESPFGVFIVVSDEENSHKFLVARHRWHEPKGCETASPSPSPSPVPTPAVTSEEPQLPVTGQNLAGEMWTFGGLAAVLITLIGLRLIARRRRGTA